MKSLIVIILLNIFQGISNSILSDKLSPTYQNLHTVDNIYNDSNPDHIKLSASDVNEKSSTKVLTSIDEFIKTTRSQMADGLCTLEIPSTLSGKLKSISICCNGYIRDEEGCVPICIKGCPYGVCTAPNTCSCWPGYKLNDAGLCTTVCENGCQHGVCDRHGQCHCKMGYKMKEATNNTECEPICEKKCKYGKCVAPNRCECQEGFSLNSQGNCSPVCSDCENGTCTDLRECLCNKGYSKVDDKCEPICSMTCENGFCSAPEICSCNVGYKLNELGTKCLEDTKLPCVNGFCYGYNMQYRRHIG